MPADQTYYRCGRHVLYAPDPHLHLPFRFLPEQFVTTAQESGFEVDLKDLGDDPAVTFQDDGGLTVFTLTLRPSA